MRFSLQGLMTLTAAFAVMCVFVGSPSLAFGSMCFALPLAIVCAGLTAPQKGTSLDVTSSPLFVQLYRLWRLLMLGLVILIALMWLFPSLRWR